MEGRPLHGRTCCGVQCLELASLNPVSVHHWVMRIYVFAFTRIVIVDTSNFISSGRIFNDYFIALAAKCASEWLLKIR